MTTNQIRHNPTKKGRTGSLAAPGTALTNLQEEPEVSETIIAQTVPCLTDCDYAADRARDDASDDGHTCQVTDALIEAPGPVGDTVTIAVSVIRFVDGDDVEPAVIEFGPVGTDPVGRLTAEQADAMSAAFATVAARLRGVA